MTAIGAIEAVGAEAHVALVGRVHTGGSVKARIVGASLLCRGLAAASVESSRAVASSVRLALHTNTRSIPHISTKRGNVCCFYRAGSTVETGNDGAVIFDQLAVGSGVLGRAGTGVGSLASVETGAAVFAGFVIGAVI